MASRLHESINSLGVLLSLAVSFFGFYYEHVSTSEAVDALIEGFNLKADNLSKPESMTVGVVFINKGDSSVTVSDVRFEFDDGVGSCCIYRFAYRQWFPGF
jgi:hypothetical protein